MTDFSLPNLSGGAAAAGESGESPVRFFRRRPLASEASDLGRAALLAQILDNIAFANPEGTATSPIQAALRERGDLRRAMGALPESARSRLAARLPGAALEELLSLSHETDPQLFAEAIYQWAGNQEREDRMEAAVLVYGLFAQRLPDGVAVLPGAPEGLRVSAAQRLDAVLGRGAAGARAEFLLRRFAREASNPVMIAGMAAGSFVFSTARTAFLSRLLATPGRGVLAARGLASTGAFLLEVPAFWATTKGLNEALAPGQQAWDLRSNLRELAGLGLTLGALKLTGAGASAVSSRLASSANPLRWSASERFGHGLLQQGSMLGGIMLGHRLEQAVGLRPHLAGATNLIDSLSMLMQFHVGGRLSQAAMGPRYQAFTQGLEARARMLEGAEFQCLGRGLQASLSGRDGPTVLGGPVFAMSSDGVENLAQGTSATGDLRPEVIAMTSLGGSANSRPSVARERGIRTDIPSALPERTGSTPDDRFATPMSPEEMLSAVRESPIHLEILSHLELQNSNWESIGERELGAAVGEALERRLGEISSHPRYAELRVLAEGNLLEVDFSKVPRFESLPEDLRASLDAAAELMQITQYAIRSHQTEILTGARSRLSPELQGVYQEMLGTIRVLKGPRLTLPSGDIARGTEVIGPESGILSHGAGAMSSWLRVVSRRTGPGGLKWYARFFATEANYQSVRSLRETGRNPNMSPAMTHNFEGDPLIEPIYFNPNDVGNSEAVARVLYRTVRVQMLNVPSWALPDMLSESFVRQLPENAILLSAIGGVIEPKGESPEYPNEFVRGRLDRYGRTDVEVVSLSGYVPADKLWGGERVTINLSTREDAEVRGQPRGAAREIARLLAGESLGNDYVHASASHWERSSNVGKVLKNVFTLEAGQRAGVIAREVVEAQEGISPQSPRFQELRDLGQNRYASAREQIKERMRSVLTLNEGIKASRADFTSEVWKDFEDCSVIFFDNLVEVFRRARQLNIREASSQQVHEFLDQEVFNAPRDRRVATTRNPRYGIARALHDMLVENGLPFLKYEDVAPDVTVEGKNSLDPILRLYNSRRDIEQRRLPDSIYALHRSIYGREIAIPPAVTGYLRHALERSPETSDARSMQAALREAGLSGPKLRLALEGSNEATLTQLSRGLRYLNALYKQVLRARERGNGNAAQYESEFQRQVEFIRQMEVAATRGNILAATRMPRPIGPYENAFVITRQDREGDRPTRQVFVRLNLEEASKRLTQLGMLLRQFAPEDSVEIDIRVPESSQAPQSFARLYELETTAREIVRSFQSQRTGNIRLSIERRSIEDEQEIPRDPPSDDFYRSLEPLARWVLQREEGAPVSREEVRQLFRNPRHQVNGVIDDLLRGGNGWVMLLTPAEGPIQSGIRAMVTRPEKATLMGVYSGDQLVDTFAVYRYNGKEARVLSHHLLRDFRDVLPENPQYSGATSVDFFNGLPLESFIRDYREYANRRGFAIDALRPIPVSSTPVEEALVGRNPRIDPAVLKVFLNRPDSPEAERLLRATERLYELPPEEARENFARLAEPQLNAFAAESAAMLKTSPLFRLYQRFGFLSRSVPFQTLDSVEP